MAMPAREILQLGNPLLFEKSSPVKNVGSRSTRTLVRDLSDTLQAFRDAHGFGRAIAAPQVGILKRIIYIKMPSRGHDGPLFNPEILWGDPETIEMWDNCLSFPGLVVRVRRSKKNKVGYLDVYGEDRVLDAEDDLSELLQHEIDHLNGILAVQRAVSPTAFMTFDEWYRQGKP